MMGVELSVIGVCHHGIDTFRAMGSRSGVSDVGAIRLFQLDLAEQGVGICTRNRTMTGIALAAIGTLAPEPGLIN
jgi:hypothetical protein